MSYLAWEWCLRSNDLQRGQVPFPCLLSHTLSSALTVVSRLWYLRRAAAAAVPWQGEGWKQGMQHMWIAEKETTA